VTTTFFCELANRRFGSINCRYAGSALFGDSSSSLDGLRDANSFTVNSLFIYFICQSVVVQALYAFEYMKWSIIIWSTETCSKRY